MEWYWWLACIVLIVVILYNFRISPYKQGLINYKFWNRNEGFNDGDDNDDDDDSDDEDDSDQTQVLKARPATLSDFGYLTN